VTDLEAQLNTWRNRLEDYLDRALPGEDDEPHALHAAMRYSTLDGGKRLRACLVYLTGNALGAPAEELDAPAAAVELIHAYSLVHDDLPCMDDDDLRRGKPSCHKAWDEPTAMLVGDALQSLAYELLAASRHTRAAEMVHVLARASGSLGMAGGQALDLGAVGRTLNLGQLRQMHALKTGALIGAAVELGALAAETDEAATLAALRKYAAAIGLGFQIRDDILDIEGDTDTLGKQTGSDAELDKPTYPSLLGLQGAKQAARQARDEAIESLNTLDIDTRQLSALADYVTNRIY
jgi:farnesyl diphosphate synthase